MLVCIHAKSAFGISHCSGIKYFGFLSVASGDGSNEGTPITEDYIDDVDGISNIIKIDSVHTDPYTAAIDSLSMVLKAADRGIYSVVSLGRIFFETTYDPFPTIDTVEWRTTTYAARWATFAAVIQPALQYIVAFYIYDEPYHNACHSSDPPISEANMKTHLETAASTIKNTSGFANTKVATVFATTALQTGYSSTPGTELNASFAIPSGYDYVGFDFLWTSAVLNNHYEDDEHDDFETEYERLLTHFISKTTSGQKLIVVPSTIFLDDGDDHDDEVSEATICDDIDYYIKVAKIRKNLDPSVEMLFNYKYPDAYDELTTTVQPYWETLAAQLQHCCDLDNTDGFSFVMPEPVAAWYMNSNGSNETDRSGNNETLTQTGGTIGTSSTVPDGYSGYSRLFTAVDTECLYHADGGSTDISGSGIAIAAWIKFSADPGADAIIATKWISTTNQRQYVFCHHHASNALLFGLSDNGTNETLAVGATDLADDTDWHFVVASYDGSNMTIYVDGFIDSNGANNPKAYSDGIASGGTAPFVVGQNSEMNAQEFNGLIDELSIYDGSLSDQQILTLMWTGIGSDRGRSD